MSKNGWIRESRKDSKGQIRLMDVFYENGRIRTKRLVEGAKIMKKEEPKSEPKIEPEKKVTESQLLLLKSAIYTTNSKIEPMIEQYKKNPSPELRNRIIKEVEGLGSYSESIGLTKKDVNIDLSNIRKQEIPLYQVEYKEKGNPQNPKIYEYYLTEKEAADRFYKLPIGEQTSAVVRPID